MQVTNCKQLMSSRLSALPIFVLKIDSTQKFVALQHYLLPRENRHKNRVLGLLATGVIVTVWPCLLDDFNY